MQTIQKQTTTADYTNATTFGPDDFEVIEVAIWNNPVIMQLFQLSSDGDFQTGAWGDELLISPQTITVQRCGGLRFKTNPATPSDPGLIVGWAWKSAEPIIIGGAQTQGTLTPSGGFTPPSLETTDGVLSVKPTGILLIGTNITLTEPVTGTARLDGTGGGGGGPPVLQLKVFPEWGTLTTGDNKLVMVASADLDTMTLSAVAAFVSTVGAGSPTNVQVRNSTAGPDMLSTPITIDAGEFTSYTAATPPVIDTPNAQVATGNLIAIDVDVAGTGAKGLGVVLEFTP